MLRSMGPLARVSIRLEYQTEFASQTLCKRVFRIYSDRRVKRRLHTGQGPMGPMLRRLSRRVCDFISRLGVSPGSEVVSDSQPGLTPKRLILRESEVAKPRFALLFKLPRNIVLYRQIDHAPAHRAGELNQLQCESTRTNSPKRYEK